MQKAISQSFQKNEMWIDEEVGFKPKDKKFRITINKVTKKNRICLRDNITVTIQASHSCGRIHVISTHHFDTSLQHVKTAITARGTVNPRSLPAPASGRQALDKPTGPA
ncbi:hypothetical protein [Bifidobacterium merycicum]|uniref:hypothetical protein n=1 Tax=Bifidobacterium merycicum TaxID=78345 RepID=UPI001160DBE8|nr:hypothetical protein [Bifidobacterium merycicum]MEE1294589.1 hypothetical protein [Bifidobacterium merycicum]NLW57927.1 hypothetical protein [Bifidobacterium pseudolongum subsp. globosum]